MDLKNQRDKLHQYQRRISVLTDRETAIAREMLARGDRARALLALRRKKYQVSLLAKTDAQLEQLEKLTSSVEFALVQKDVVFGLQQGTKVLREIHREMGGLEHVEELMGETAEAIAYQQVRPQLSLCDTETRRMLTFYPRKLATCSAVEYPIRMRMRSRKSSRPWRQRLLVCHCRMFQWQNLPNDRQRIQNCSGRRGSSRNKGLQHWHEELPAGVFAVSLAYTPRSKHAFELFQARMSNVSHL